MDRATIFYLLEQTPAMLEELLAEIPKEIFTTRRIKNKWSIHEHACHLGEAQKNQVERTILFKNTKNPVIKPYLPGVDQEEDALLKLDLDQSLKEFRENRNRMISLLKEYTEEDWANEAQHPEYFHFNPAIYVRHIIMHDHLHMYRIEELWLTRDEYLP